jgi:3-oxoacyl-(acyl-carrier-protein) synthase
MFSVAATRMALKDAGIDLAKEDRDRIGAMMGTALGGIARAEAEHRHFVEGGVRAVEPTLALQVYAGAASCNIAIEFGLCGPNSTNGMSCASGTIAVGDGFRAIRTGRCGRHGSRRRGSSAGTALLCRLCHHPGDVYPE